MKAALPLVLAMLALTGCATLGSLPSDASVAPSANDSSSASSPAIADPFPPKSENLGPQIIIPVTGGPPVLGIPVGGNLFIPVTGGPPVTGIPTSP
jgi:hypothetical protein